MKNRVMGICKKHWKKLIMALIPVILYLLLGPPNSLSYLGFNWNLKGNTSVKASLEDIKPKAKLISGLDIDKPINKLSNNIYGYVYPIFFISALSDKDIGKMKFYTSVYKSGDENYLFKVIKISNDKIYLFGYVNNENYLNLNDPEYAKDTQITLFPSRYNDYTEALMVLLNNENIKSIAERNVERSDGKGDIVELKALQYEFNVDGY